MASVTRARRCFECKRRRKKCDGANPVCGNCARWGTPCSGAPTGLSFVINEGPDMAASFSSQRQVHTARPIAPAGRDFPQPPTPAVSRPQMGDRLAVDAPGSVYERLLQRFATEPPATSSSPPRDWAHSAVDRHLCDFVEHERAVVLADPARTLTKGSGEHRDWEHLDCAVRCVALYGISGHPGLEAVRTIAMAEYGTSLRLLNVALGASSSEVPLECFLTVMMLLRVSWNLETHRSHMDGLAQMTISRAEAWFLSPLSVDIFNAVRVRLLCHMGHSYLPLPFDLSDPDYAWFSRISRTNANKWDELLHLAVVMPDLRARSRPAIIPDQHDLPGYSESLRADADGVIQRLDAWHHSLPAAWQKPNILPMYEGEQSSDASGWQQPIAHTYPDTSVAVVILRFYVVKIWILQVINTCLEWQIEMTGMTNLLNQRLRATTDRINISVYNLCCTIAPFSTRYGEVWELSRKMHINATLFIDGVLTPCIVALPTLVNNQPKRDWIVRKLHSLAANDGATLGKMQNVYGV